jgi:hypothetical protein
VLSSGHIPIISPIGVSDNGKLYNINAATASSELVIELDPEKYVMITSSRGVLDNPSSKNSGLISKIVLRKGDYDRLVADGILTGGMKKNVDEAIYSLTTRENGDDRSVQIVNPGNLIAELFTKKGYGTYIRKGYDIEKQPIRSVKQSIVRGVVQRAFAQELLDDYFSDTRRIAYVEANTKGVGIVFPHTFAQYLDVLAVDPEYQRNGLGNDIIDSIGERIFWRSKPSRKDINLFYFKISDGHQRFTAKDGIVYNGFWKGLQGWDPIMNAMMIMRERDSNFKLD